MMNEVSSHMETINGIAGFLGHTFPVSDLLNEPGQEAVQNFPPEIVVPTGNVRSAMIHTVKEGA